MYLALPDYISDILSKNRPTFNPKMCSSHLSSIKAHIDPFYLEFQNSKLLPLYVIISFPPKLYVTHSGHMISSSGLLLARRAASDCMFLSQYLTFELWLVSGNKSLL